MQNLVKTAFIMAVDALGDSGLILLGHKQLIHIDN
jgi:hypothetical protein